MKTMILASAAVLALGIGSAFANGGDSEGAAEPNTTFTSKPGVVATAQPPAVSPYAVAEYRARAAEEQRQHGVWVFPAG
jgi:hypothetical protein